MGPYRVSFDLNTTNEYYVNASFPAKYGETYSGIKYVMFYGHINGIRLGNIEITYFDSNEIDSSLDSTKSMVEDYLQSTEFHYVDTYNRIINGKPGILGVGKSFENDLWFDARYWLSNNTMIEIKSDFPWDDGMLSILKTIRVELVGKPPTFLED